MAKFLIVGLGNIGAEYQNTRHNIGFAIAEAFVSKHQAQFKVNRLAELAEVRFKGKSAIVIKPTTYMNLSGKAVKYWMDIEKIALDSVLVLVDEVALPLNKMRLRPSGSDGGHNGLKSIQEILQTDKYPRLRFGIGNDYPKGRQVDYVLGDWSLSELPVVKLKIDKCVEVIENFMTIGIERTMNEVNKLEFIL
ncbi:MAG TPA: aminoacyl-tRNA hydrolase [Flavitalea sp.]|nr:aminoacyl-tRNA hydrolase [Flavitalea sp.]